MKTQISCINFRGVAVSENEDYVRVAQLRCKQWSCPYCADKNAKQWRASLIHHINRLDCNWSFITITLPSWLRKLDDRTERYERGMIIIKQSWDKFMKRLRRYLKPHMNGEKMEYMRIVETHKDGVPHIHLMVNCWIPDSVQVVRKDKSKYWRSKEIEKHLKACGFGYIHDARNLETPKSSNNKYHAGSVALYITKYITKDLASDDDYRKSLRVRKIQTSRGITRVNLETQYEWSLKTAIMIEDVATSDVPYYDVTTGSILTLKHFMGGIIYPPEQSPDYDGDD